MGGVLYELRCSGSGLAYNDYDNNYSNSNVSSHLCNFTYSTDPATRQKKSQSLNWLVMKVKASFNKQSMKRIGNLYEQICSLENLQLADQKARKGKSWQYGVRIHDLNREDNIIQLRQSLLTRAYKTSEYTIFKVFEPKERDVYRLPYYPDRIAHHAIMNVMEAVFVSVFTTDTYSCIKKRGIHAAAKAVKKALKDQPGTQYCLKLDITKFYPTINHDILKALLRRKIKDADLLWLLDASAYKKWRDRYQGEIAICQKYLMDMSKPMDEYQSFFKENLPRLGSLYYHYHNSDLHTKQALVKQVFNFQLYYHDGMYRTPYIMPVFAHNALVLKEKRLLEIEQPFSKSAKVLECAPNQTPLEHILPLSNLLNLLKSA